jgi:hypothetical protein
VGYAKIGTRPSAHTVLRVYRGPTNSKHELKLAYRSSIAQWSWDRPLRKPTGDDLIAAIFLAFRSARRYIRIDEKVRVTETRVRIPLGPHTSLDLGHFELAGEVVA